MRRERLRRAFLMIVIGAAMTALLAACGTSTTTTAPPRSIASTTSGATSPFVLSTLVSGPTGAPAPAQPTNTAAPRPTTFPTSTPIPRTGSAVTTPRATSTQSGLPTGAATSAPMSGTRNLTNQAAAYQLSYPSGWNVTTQGNTVSISPETGATHIAGFLIETVRNPTLSPEDDLKDAIMPSGSGGTPYTATGKIAPVMVAGEPGFRVDVRVSLSGTSSRGSATASGPVYAGSIITTSHKGVNYRIGLFARDGDTMTLMQAEQVLASLRFT